MPELWAEVGAIDGLIWIIGAAFVAGMVRGFAGFGTAMIYLPVAGQFLPPVWAIVTLAMMDLLGPLPNVPGAWKAARKPDLARLLGAMAVVLPVGLAVLVAVDPEIFRYVVSCVALVLLVVLISGFRYHGAVHPGMLYGVGGTAGFLGGVAGMPGPPVILFYMASPHGAAVIRANNMLFLLGYDILIVVMLTLKGLVAAVPLTLGLLLTVPNFLGNMVGGLVFRPGYERVYRAVAYAIIAVSAISGLPLWS